MNRHTFIHIPSHGRIEAFDSLRSLIIFFVILLHVSMTYMLDTPSWWYVISAESSTVLLVIANILDVLMMPVLFFISGYFTPASYLKKGALGFLKDKTKHILLPWLLGIVLLTPLIPLFSGKSLEYIIGELTKNPFYLFHAQGHLWYLGVLFIFLFIYASYAYFFHPANERTLGTTKKNVSVLIMLIIVSIICAYLSGTYITHFDNWIFPAYIFTLKPAKFITYGSIFVMGIYAWKKNWFIKGGWMPPITVWRILAISTTTCFVLLRLIIIPDYNFLIAERLQPVLDAICSFTTLMYILLIGIKFQTTRISVFLMNVSPYSYGIYWVHMPITVLYLYLINDLQFPIIIKWISGIIVTCILSWLISKYILKKLPLLRDMF